MKVPLPGAGVLPRDVGSGRNATGGLHTRLGGGVEADIRCLLLLLGRRRMGDVGVGEDFVYDVGAATLFSVAGVGSVFGGSWRAPCGVRECRQRAGSAMGSGVGRGVGSSTVGCTAVFPNAALFEDCVRGVDAGCHQGRIGPVRDACVERFHVTLKCVSGPGLGRRADEYELSVWWCRSLTKRGRVRVKYGGSPPYSFRLWCRSGHTVSPPAPGPAALARRRGARVFR